MHIPKDSIPPVLPVSPIAVECPHCKAQPGHDCITDSGLFSIVHLARISAAASISKAPRKN